MVARILDGTYPMGGRLPPERELAAALGTNRNTLRVTMQALEERGLVERRWGAGVTVRDWRQSGTLALVEDYLALGLPSEDPALLFRQLARLRQATLAELGAIAAADGSAAHCARIRAAARELEKASASADGTYLEREQELLAALADASGSVLVRWVYNTFVSVFLAVAEVIPELALPPPGAHRLLREVVEAIAARRQGQTRAAVARWIGALDAHRAALLGLKQRPRMRRRRGRVGIEASST